MLAKIKSNIISPLPKTYQSNVIGNSKICLEEKSSEVAPANQKIIRNNQRRVLSKGISPLRYAPVEMTEKGYAPVEMTERATLRSK